MYRVSTINTLKVCSFIRELVVTSIEAAAVCAVTVPELPELTELPCVGAGANTSWAIFRIIILTTVKSFVTCQIVHCKIVQN